MSRPATPETTRRMHAETRPAPAPASAPTPPPTLTGAATHPDIHGPDSAPDAVDSDRKDPHLVETPYTTAEGARLAMDALRGLGRTPRHLPAKLLYDERGAALFDEITRLPEYYPTRTETTILCADAPAIAEWVGPHARIIEFGSGSGEKARILLHALDRPAEYVPIDIAGPQLHTLAGTLRTEFPELTVRPFHADYTTLPAELARSPEPTGRDGTNRRGRTIVFFPGSTIGNLEPSEARAFLEYTARVAGRGGGLLIGADLKKDTRVIERAYNDARGVTAAFNLNVLAHVNRLLRADFDASAFEHHAFYNAEAGRIEMHLVSAAAQRVRLEPPGSAALTISVGAGEAIVTEYSYKYAPDGFSALVEECGYVRWERWTDAKGWFGVFAFDAGGSAR